MLLVPPRDDTDPTNAKEMAWEEQTVLGNEMAMA
jgi:hypothetical protein